MQAYPHHYKVAAAATSDGNVSLSSEGVADIISAPPKEFGGPGDKWSPETLLVASVADCFILSFQGISRASRLSWISLQCEVEGILERSEGTTKFTSFLVRATLVIPEETRSERAHRLLEKAENSCLITNSLSGETHLEAVVNTV
jgi:peroxiredoxin-like protein